MQIAASPAKAIFGPQSQTKGRKRRKENPESRGERESNDFKLMPRFIRKNAAAAAMSASLMHHSYRYSKDGLGRNLGFCSSKAVDPLTSSRYMPPICTCFAMQFSNLEKRLINFHSGQIFSSLACKQAPEAENDGRMKRRAG